MTESIATITASVANSLADSDREILQAIFYSPNHSASALQLKALLGLKSIVQANAAIGRLGKKIYQQLGHHPDGLELGAFQWWSVATTGCADSSLGFVWTLRDGVVNGLSRAGYSAAGTTLPEEVDPIGLVEGSVKRVAVNAYERNPVARARCIATFGTTCVVCEFDFGVVYGPSAQGYIHVHHLVPVSTIGKAYEVNPVTDLRPICPNCHAVIHMSNPPKTIDEVRALLAPNISQETYRHPQAITPIANSASTTPAKLS
ncbi:MAG: HNH endonuclease [Rhodanobacter sp.]